MSSTWLLILRGLRQSPFQAVSVVVLTALSTALLTIGVLNSTQFPAAYAERLDELHTADLVFGVDGGQVEVVEQTLRDDPRVESIDPAEPLFTMSASVATREGDITNEVLVYGLDDALARGQLAIRSELAEDLADGIYVPHQLSVLGDYELGDRVVFDTGAGEVTGSIQGFIERPYFTSNAMGIYSIAVPTERLDAFVAAHPQLSPLTMVQAHLAPGATAAAVASDVQDALATAYGPSSPLTWFEREMLETYSTLPAMITSMLLLAFVVIITSVVVVVLAYLCAQRVQRDLVGIGTLKALGMSAARIRLALLGMFAGLTLLGIAIGTIATYLIAPTLAAGYSEEAGFEWTPAFSWAALGLAVLFVGGATVAATLVGTRKVGKYSPIAALRGTVSTHSFTRNVLPLDTSRGATAWLLAMKTALRNRAQLVSVGVVIALFTFAGVFAITMSNAVINHQRNFTDLLSGGMADVAVTVADDAPDVAGLVERVSELDGVDSAYAESTIEVKTDAGVRLDTSVLSDGAALRYDPTVEGRLPVHDNEIAVGVTFAHDYDVGVGDTVSITFAGETRELLVSGIVQGTRQLGLLGFLSESGLQSFAPDARLATIAINAVDGTDMTELIAQLRAEFGSSFAEVTDLATVVGAQLDMYVALVLAFSQAVLVIAAVVIVLVLWLMISTLLRDFGLMRAVGYTWPQLAGQVALSYAPLLAVSVAVGAVLGALLFNPLITGMLIGMGVSNANLPVVGEHVAVLAVATVAFGVLVALGLASRTQRISPSELLREA
jgi:putative ABC transport system permease protein